METWLVSALVAGVVTLLIEYAAKPGLEARKERILAKEHGKRERVEAYDRLVFEIERYRATSNKETGRREELLDQALRRAFAEVEGLYLLGRRTDVSSDDPFAVAVDSSCAILEAVRLVYLDDSEHRKVLPIVEETLQEVLDLAADARKLRWWNWRKRSRLRRELESVRTSN